MKNFGFIAFVTVLLFMGCSDTEGTLDLKGQVLDEETKVTIPRRKVIIQAFIEGDDNKTPVYVGQFLTDSVGCFTYTLKKVKHSHLYNFYLIGDSTYASSTNLLGLTELKRDGMFLTFNLCKLTDFTITIFRKCKIPFCDTLYVSWKSNGMDGKILYPYKIENYGVSPDKEFRWIGGNVKSVIETKALANKETIICMELIRKGEKKEILHTVYCERDVNNNFSFKY